MCQRKKQTVYSDLELPVQSEEEEWEKEESSEIGVTNHDATSQ